jgi:predicted nucleic acid-binding protein
MYAGGTEHPFKAPCLEVLHLAQVSPSSFVTDAEVLQELLHRYKSINRWDRASIVFSAFADLMRGRVEPMLVGDVELAASLVTQHPRLSARDAIHLAVMQRLGITRIVTTDGGFGEMPGIERLDPLRIEEWRDSVG